MVPTTFRESNRTLAPPPSMTEDECSPLPVWSDGRQCISCWRLTWRERLSALLVGRVWLSVIGGYSQPPVWLSAKRTVFVKPDPQAQSER